MKKSSIKAAVLVVIVAMLVTATLVFPVRSWLTSALEWIQGLGPWAPVFVVGFYVIACLLFLPGSILTLGAGFLFKLVVGTITVSIGSTLSACAAFIVGRTFARNWISQKIGANKKFAAIDKAVGEHGFKIVLLLRLSPVFPFNLLNYAFGLTRVSFRQYALGSWIGMLPGTVMYVYFGAGLRSLAAIAAGEVETGMAGRLFFWFGMAATVAVTVFITHIARKALRQHISAPDMPSETAGDAS